MVPTLDDEDATVRHRVGDGPDRLDRSHPITVARNEQLRVVDVREMVGRAGVGGTDREQRIPVVDNTERTEPTLRDQVSTDSAAHGFACENQLAEPFSDLHPDGLVDVEELREPIGRLPSGRRVRVVEGDGGEALRSKR